MNNRFLQCFFIHSLLHYRICGSEYGLILVHAVDREYLDHCHDWLIFHVISKDTVPYERPRQEGLNRKQPPALVSLFCIPCVHVLQRGLFRFGLDSEKSRARKLIWLTRDGYRIARRNCEHLFLLWHESLLEISSFCDAHNLRKIWQTYGG